MEKKISSTSYKVSFVKFFDDVNRVVWPKILIKVTLVTSLQVKCKSLCQKIQGCFMKIILLNKWQYELYPGRSKASLLIFSILNSVMHVILLNM